MYLDVYVLFGCIYSIKGTTFKVTNEQNVWNPQFDCGTGYEMAGKNAFSKCQPETCKKINLDIDDKRIKINYTYWLNGYMLTSPIMDYLGCFEMKSTEIGAYRTTIPNNDVLMCSLFCKGYGFNTDSVIILKEDACSCLPSSNLIEMTKRIDSRMHQNHNVGCSVQCPGDNTDQCGDSDYFSVYNITENEIRGRDHSCICENLQNKAIEECKTCPEDLRFLCHNISENEINCSQIPLTWRQELRTCLKSGASLQILTRFGESCDITVAVDHNDFQYRFVKLLFVWNTRPESTYDYKCLGLRLGDEKEFKLLPINCSEKRKALCHKVSDEDSTEDLDGLWTQHTTLQSTSYITVFNVSEVKHTWDRTTDNCIDGWTLSGKRMFNSCRSDSCQTVNANDMLPNIKNKNPFLWIDGYVVRSPVMEYYECLNLTDLHSTVNAVQHMHMLNHNGIEKCSLFCKQDEYLKDRDFILLQNDTCYCVRYATLEQWNKQGKTQKVSTKSCDTCCDGDKFDRCGGRKTLFSAYKLIGGAISDEIGGNCFFTVGTDKKRNRISCKERLSFKCEAVMKSDGHRKIDVKCVEIKMNWYDARKTCNISNKYIQLINNNCDSNRKIQDKIWHNRFVKERIVWNADIPTDKYKENGYNCLAMKLTEDSNYILTAQKCDNEYYSLCQKDVRDTNGITTNNEQETEGSKGSVVSMYVGIAVALTFLLILVIVLAVCIRRRKRYNPKDASTAPDVYYSTVTGNQIQENQSHTLDGANADQSNANLMISSTTINAYTDNDQHNNDILKKGAIYDQADSNEYDVSSTCKKYSPKIEEDVCYYDHSRDADTMYDATDTKGLIQRNEMSDIYDHTREIDDAYDVSHAYRQQDKTVNESVYTQSDF